VQLTRTSDKLKRSILFDTERRESIFVPPIDSGYFSLILIKSGKGIISPSTDYIKRQNHIYVGVWREV